MNNTKHIKTALKHINKHIRVNGPSENLDLACKALNKTKPLFLVEPMTGYSPVPAQVIKVSSFRKFLGLPHIKLALLRNTMKGFQTTVGWYSQGQIKCN